MNLQPANVDTRTQLMLGAGCDGHAIRALGNVLSEHVHSFRSAQYRRCALRLYLRMWATLILLFPSAYATLGTATQGLSLPRNLAGAS